MVTWTDVRTWRHGPLEEAGESLRSVGTTVADLKQDAQCAGTQIISRAIVKEIVANRLKTDASGIEFGQIYLVKRHASGLRGDEYFYEAKAKSNGFSYDFKIAARGGEILKLKIKS